MSTITTGRHAVTVIAAEVGETPNTGSPGVFLTFRDAEGAEINGTLWLTDKALERTINTLRECFGFNDDFATLSDQLIDRECSITVEMEADQKDATKSWPRVRWVNPLNRSSAKPAGGDLLSRLSSQAKRIAKPAGFVPAPPRPAPATPVAAPAQDGDVPF